MTQNPYKSPVGYGAFEMKTKYRRNMLTGTMFSALLAIGVVAGFFLLPGPSEEAVVEVGLSRLDSTIIVINLEGFQIKDERAPVRGSNRKLLGESGSHFIPVDDDFIDYEPTTTRHDWYYAGGDSEGTDGPGDDFSQPGFTDGSWGGEYPDPGKVVFVEQIPVMIYEHRPVYPRLAKQAGWEGTLWVRALVDIDGTVHDAFVVKSDCPKVGFEKAALTSAYKFRYKPAIQNGYPVPVWVTYKVEFVLNKD